MTRPSPHPAQSGHTLQHFLDYFYYWEKNQPQAPYLRQPQSGQYTDYSWAEVGRQARQMVTALRHLGLAPQTRIGLYGKNSAHWIIADLAIKMGGWVSVPFYPNLTAAQLEEVMRHSGCQVLFAGKLDDPTPVYEGVPAGVRRIALPLCPAQGLDRWEDIIAQHEPALDPYVPQADDLESIVYTSGTTGSPKGVMKTFGATAAVIEPVRHVTGIDRLEGRFFSYLPLNHDAERAVVEGGSLLNGGTVYFAESLDTFMDDLRAARPTVFLAVPRIWTRFQLGVLEKVPQEKLDRLLRIPIVAGFIKRRIQSNWAWTSSSWPSAEPPPFPPPP
jgi:long-chain acyl-CoA synthetase